MKNKIVIAALSSLALVTAACGGGGPDRDALVDQLVEAAAGSGATIDEACARELADKLPDADVEKILEAGPDGDPDVSAEADDIAMELIGCVEDFGDSVGTDTSTDLSDISIPEGVEINDAMVDLIASSLEESGMTVDRDCIGEALEGMDLSAVATAEPSPELMQAFLGCMTP